MGVAIGGAGVLVGRTAVVVGEAEALVGGACVPVGFGGVGGTGALVAAAGRVGTGWLVDVDVAVAVAVRVIVAVAVNVGVLGGTVAVDVLSGARPMALGGGQAVKIRLAAKASTTRANLQE